MVDLISIKINQLKKQLGNNQALDGVSLEFTGGEIHGIIGPEGAGKTTLMRLILGLLKPDAGNVNFIQNDKCLLLPQIRNSIAYMPERQALYPDLSIDEHLVFLVNTDLHVVN